MKTLKSILALLIAVSCFGAAVPINVQKKDGVTNEITADLVVGDGRTMRATGTGQIIATGSVPSMAINLAASGAGGVTGNLPVTNLNSGTNAASDTFWAGDGTWKKAQQTSGSSLLSGNGTGGFTNVTIGSGLSFATPTLSVTADAGLPSQTSHSGQFLTTNGMSSSWAALSNGTVTSIGMTVPSFLSVSPSSITTSGVFAVTYSGTALPVANGGTGALTAALARTSLGLVIGADIQAWSSNLDAWSAKTPYAGALTITSGKTFSVENSIVLRSTSDGVALQIGGGGTLGTAAFQPISAFEVPLTFSTGLTRVSNTVTADAVNLAGSGSGGVSGNLPITRLNFGTNANATTFWRGDQSWQVPNFEPPLGNPAVTGYVLASTTAGARYWVANGGGGGGSGTVTSIPDGSTNGVIWTVTSRTTTPTFTFSLGAITPTTVRGNTITTGTGTLTLGSVTLNAGPGGTLGTAAFTAASAYEVPLTFSTGLTRTTNTVTVNTSQNIATLSNLTSNGLVTTSGGTGALSITSASSFVPAYSGLTTNGILQATGATTVASTLTPAGLTSVTATTFIGALTGNASTATTATNATNVATTQASSNATYYPLFVASSTNGNQAVDLGTGLTFNPSTNTLSTTTFSGAVTGNATTATALATTHTIGGSNFNGTQDVTSLPSPGAIGGMTPNTGKFTTLQTTGVAAIGDDPASNAFAALTVASGTTGATQRGIYLNPSLDHTATRARGIDISTTTIGSDSAATLINAYGLNIAQPTLANGSTVTTNAAIMIGNQTIGGTNYAIFTNTGLVRFGDNVSTTGTLTLGSGPTIISDSVGKILPAALNTVPIAQGGTGQVTANAGFNALSPMTTAGDIIYGGTSGAGTRLATGTSVQVLHGGTTPSWAAVSLTADVSGVLPVANGGTNASSASITAFNNITGYTAAGATGTTSTNLVFSTSPTLVAPALGTIASGNGAALTSLTAANISAGALATGMAAITQAAGTSDTTLATTAFVQTAVLQGIAKEAAKYASTAALPTVVYANGSSGVGATLTGAGLGALSLDSNTPSVADRVLIKNQASTFQNGIYTVTAVGSGAAVFVMTRAVDFNQSVEIKTGDSVFVISGTVNGSTTWVVSSADSPVIGTDAITFSQTAGPGSITSGNGITVTGASVAIDTSVTVDKTTVQTLTNKTLTAAALGSSTATTQSAADNSTKVATTAYADNATRATFSGTMATPSQVSASPTWVSPVLEIYISTEGGTPGTRSETLPAAASYTGQAIILYVAVTATSSRHVNFLTGSGAVAYLNGVIMTSGHYLQCAAPTAGNFMILVSDGVNWISHGNSGTWTDASGA